MPLLRFFLAVLLCFSTVCASAQIGIALSHRSVYAPYWQGLIGENVPLFGNGHGFAADYRIKLKDVHLDIMPEAGFAKFKTPGLENTGFPEGNFYAEFYNLQLNGNVYPFDFFDRLDKKEKLTSAENMRRSVFVQIAPGATMTYLSYRDAAEEMLLPPRRTAFFIGLGAGFDIHYKNYLSLTPMLRFQHYPTVRWDGLGELADENTGDFFREETSVNQLAFSLRLGVFWR